jgi:hypothetical protein
LKVKSKDPEQEKLILDSELALKPGRNRVALGGSVNPAKSRDQKRSEKYSDWREDCALVSALQNFKRMYPTFESRNRNCYPLALSFALDAHFRLVHGSIARQAGVRLHHAWNENDRWVFDPVISEYFRPDNYTLDFETNVDRRYSAIQAGILGVVSGNCGPWYEEEIQLASDGWPGYLPSQFIFREGL